MTAFAWTSAVAELSPAALTVQAQTVSPNDDGSLIWDQIMPRLDVNSVELSNLIALDYRPAADRRTWDQRGRRIPLRTPDMRKLTMEPIEANFRIDEFEMQKLAERFVGNQQLLQNQIKADVPSRTEGLAQAVYRRLDLDTIESWTLGQVTVRDPETGESYTVPLQIPSERLATAGTIWSDGSVNAYRELVAFLRDAVDLVGGIKGVMLRYAPLLAVLNDAPTLAGGAAMSLAQLGDRISQDIASPFQFFINEKSADVFDDGGINTTRTKKWPAGRIAVIPSDNRIGRVAFAPVARAMDLSQQVPEAKIDVRGVSVFPASENGGRSLVVEAQGNMFPVPDTNRVAVINTLVTA